MQSSISSKLWVYLCFFGSCTRISITLHLTYLSPQRKCELIVKTASLVLQREHYGEHHSVESWDPRIDMRPSARAVGGARSASYYNPCTLMF